ncbi:MAG: hypothetical protein R2762_15550 [Bryobacteraceae bacterium]
MRTTLTLEDDLFEELNRRCAIQGKPFKQVVNDALRLGLGLVPPPEPQAPFRVVPFEGGLLTGIDPRRLNQLNDELEMDAYSEKQQRRTSQ